ncbi:MAG TPA: N-acetylmuramoyl-L-alanine amidase [Hyphomicrobiaceae bacterium]|nr:N-acetylmuramoyl-L-alanine amidase [Hyphomicrobiaceae bacterium]
MRLAGWLRGARLLQAAVCLAAAAAAAGALAQTEIRKTLPERPNSQSEVKSQSEVTKTLPGQALQSVEPPTKSTKSTWSTETGEAPERGISATDAQVTSDGRRTRFALHLSAGVSYQIFTLADPYRLIIDLPDVQFQLPKAAGQREQGLIQAFRYGLFAAGKSRIVIDVTGPVRIEQTAVAKRPGSKAVILNIDLAPTDAASFVPNPPVAMRVPETPAAAAPKPGGKPVVLIDAGHGGVDPGAVRGEVIEKDVVLAVARHLRTFLANKGRYDVQMTRSTDVFVPLDRRLQISKEKGASLFISIHADTVAAEERAQIVRGATVYTLSEQASNKQAKALADKENAVDKLAGIDTTVQEEGGTINQILYDLMRRETADFSADFRGRLLGHMQQSIALSREPARSAEFRVLKQAHAPSVLIELGYMSNAEDSRLLSAPEWQRQVANAIALAVDDFFQKRGQRSP